MFLEILGYAPSCSPHNLGCRSWFYRWLNARTGQNIAKNSQPKPVVFNGTGFDLGPSQNCSIRSGLGNQLCFWPSPYLLYWLSIFRRFCFQLGMGCQRWLPWARVLGGPLKATQHIRASDWAPSNQTSKGLFGMAPEPNSTLELSEANQTPQL